MTLRRVARSTASGRGASALVSVLERLDRGSPDLLAVLTYHRVADPATKETPAALYVSPGDFEEHLTALTRRYTVISASELLDARHGRGRLPRHALLLTFDDAYVDFEANAWPILRERSLPAVLFVPTDYPDQPRRWFWWDRLGEVLSRPTSATSVSTPVGEMSVATPVDRENAYRLLRDHAKRVGIAPAVEMVEQIAESVGAPPARNQVLGWNAIRRLADEGVEIAPHSRSHALLTALPDEQLDEELSGSRADVERELGSSVPCFAYPSGAYDQRVVRATRSAGYDLAFTTRRGVNDLRKDPWLTLRRVNVGHGANSRLLRAQVGSWMTLRASD